MNNLLNALQSRQIYAVLARWLRMNNHSVVSWIFYETSHATHNYTLRNWFFEKAAFLSKSLFIVFTPIMYNKSLNSDSITLCNFIHCLSLAG